jgi:hypothetical protein
MGFPTGWSFTTHKDCLLHQPLADLVRLREVARQRYPDDNMAAEAAARALFDADEAASYAANLDARAEEQDVLDTARAATRLRGELREELQAPAAPRRSMCTSMTPTWTMMSMPTTSPTSSFPPTRKSRSPLPSRGH